MRRSRTVGGRTTAIGSAMAVAIAGLLIAAPARSAAHTTVFIQSPSRNIACQLDSGLGALCTVFSLSRQASVSQRGKVRVFAQSSNPPSEGVRTLPYGRSLRVGHVRCTSRRTGMRCVQLPGRHGYVASRSGFKTL